MIPYVKNLEVKLVEVFAASSYTVVSISDSYVISANNR